LTSQPTRFAVAIPARYASTRLPGKPLCDIAGLPMIVRVFRQAEQSGADEIVIATDDDRVAAVAEAAGARVCMTAHEHESGTDRIAELAAKLQWPDDRIVVNVQGDEPLIPPELIRQVAELSASRPSSTIATLATKIGTKAEFEDPKCVKLVVDRSGRAMYFSRAPIPWPREGQETDILRRHVGIYAYRVDRLRTLAQEPPCVLEQIERLEQLRALWLGHEIVVADAIVPPPIGIDTEADLLAVRAMF